MRLRGSSKFVGVAFVSFLDLLSPHEKTWTWDLFSLYLSLACTWVVKCSAWCMPSLYRSDHRTCYIQWKMVYMNISSQLWLDDCLFIYRERPLLEYEITRPLQHIRLILTMFQSSECITPPLVALIISQEVNQLVDSESTATIKKL